VILIVKLREFFIPYLQRHHVASFRLTHIPISAMFAFIGFFILIFNSQIRKGEENEKVNGTAFDHLCNGRRICAAGSCFRRCRTVKPTRKTRLII
jgi:hypothetical protein